MPTDNFSFHIFYNFHSRYVHNNIFFSFAVDADLEQSSRKKGLDASSKTENTGSQRIVPERVGNHLPHGGNRVSEKSDGCNAETTNGGLDLGHDVPAENQLAESEQATYASANNDLKGTKAYQEADVPGLYNLAMAIIDYRGHRVVAQVCSFSVFSF